MFGPDKPIESQTQDLLGRYNFSQSLGEAILSYDGSESISIGLLGPWGCGKTSIINMSLEYIKQKTHDFKEKAPIIINFNPWLFSDQDQLISKFFKQLSTAVEKKDYSENAKNVSRKLSVYADFFKPLALVPSIGPFTIMLSKLFKSVGEATRNWGEYKEKDLTSIRDELNRILAKLSQKIIVVIDDIDRLNNIEIRQIFQLVKSLGDFPNTIYLLAFDKNVVIQALGKVQEGNGSSYLEKVIQVPFEMPAITKSDIEKLLFSKLDILLQGYPEKRWNQVYWGNIYHSALKSFFKNLRDVTRYINILNFSFPLVKNELNAVDLFAIIGLQVFIPNLYHFIKDNKDIFAGSVDSFTSNSQDKEKNRSMCDEAINKATSVVPTESIVDFLKRLFPKLEYIYSNTNYGSSWLANWRKDGRICSPDIFDAYFQLSLKKDDLTRQDIEDIIEQSYDTDKFRKALVNLNKNNSISRFLERMEDYTREDVNEESIESIIQVLMDIGDFFPEGEYQFGFLDSSMRVMRIIHQLIMRFDSKDKRFNILKNAINHAHNSIYTIVRQIVILDQEQAKYDDKRGPEPVEKQTVTPEQLTMLESIARGKIETWAKNASLINHKKLVSILYMWRRWGGSEQVNEYIRTINSSIDYLVNFLEQCLYRVNSQGISVYVGKTSWTMRLDTVKDFFNLDELEKRIRALRNSVDFNILSEHQKLAVTIFLKKYDGDNDDDDI